MAEESGLIVEIGNWVLSEAARQRAEWHARGLADGLTVAVNVSPLQFKRGTVLPTLLRLQREYGLSSGFLELEVTESMLMEGTERTIEDLTAIRQPVSYTHLTLPTKEDECRSRWSPYH